MSKKNKIGIAILLIAISAFSAVVVLANSADQILYLPLVYSDYDPTPTPTPTPLPQEILITGFTPSNNPQEDFVTLLNNTSGTLDLTGWWLKAETQSGRYNFPDAFTLTAGDTVNVRSGAGSDTADDLYIGLPYSLWTVATNCVYVRDSAGDLQDKRCVSEGPVPTPTPIPTASVYISGFNVDTVPENDYVTVSNSTSESFDLTDWWMKGEAQSGRYDFPDGFILYGYGSVNIRSGIGTDTASDLYIGLTYSIWMDPYNCAYLRYEDGTLLDKKCVYDTP
jgi:hypothetical protein